MSGHAGADVFDMAGVGLAAGELQPDVALARTGHATVDGEHLVDLLHRRVLAAQRQGRADRLLSAGFDLEGGWLGAAGGEAKASDGGDDQAAHASVISIRAALRNG